MCNLARSNLATGLYQEGFLGPGDFPLLHERCLGNSSGGARAMLQKNMCHLRMAVLLASQRPIEAPISKNIHCTVKIASTFQNPATKIDCTLTYCASNECHHHRRKERRWEKASHAFGVSRLQFPPECFLPCPTLTRRVCRSVHFSRVSPPPR